MTAIDPTDLAVVVQGPVGTATAATLASVRRHLPGARVVLSTWAGTAVDGLDADAVVLSADPGAYACTTIDGTPGPPVNTNRMIVSTAAGLAAAERPWALKLRTDAVVEHAGVLGWFDRLEPVTGEWALFDRLVGVSSVYTRNPLKTPTGSFHPADTVQFGSTRDLTRLWDVPLMPPEDADHFPDAATRPVWAVTSQRFYPEQWVFISALRRRYVVPVEHRAVFDEATMRASNRALAQNLVVVEPWQLGVRVPHLERALRWGEDPLCVVTHPIWRQLRDEALRPARG